MIWYTRVPDQQFIYIYINAKHNNIPIGQVKRKEGLYCVLQEMRGLKDWGCKPKQKQNHVACVCVCVCVYNDSRLNSKFSKHESSNQSGIKKTIGWWVIYVREMRGRPFR